MQLLERADELEALAGSWAQASSGAGGLVVIHAEPGGGKTSLVQAFVQTLPEGAVLWGSCDPLATPRPLGPLYDMADRLGETTQSLLRGHGQAHAILAAVLADLDERSRVLVVEDLHWADQGTVELLRFLLRRIGTTRSLVVATVRADETDPSHPVRALLGDVARSPDARSLALRPLSPAAVRTMVKDRALDPERLHALTGGNPFFVTEMLDHEGEDLPATVRDAVLARTADLDDEALALLDLLVCAPESIPDRVLPHLGVSLPLLRSLDRAGLIRRSLRGVAFRHDLLRLALADSLPPGGEATLHRRMLDALETTATADPAVLAYHARGAGDAARILVYAPAAGRAATRAGAHTQAAEFFEIALDHGAPPAPTTQADLLELLAGEYYLLDRLDDAVAACQRVMRLRQEAGDPAGVSAAHQALSLYEWYGGNRRAADRHAAEAVAVLGPSGDRELLGHSLAMQALLHMHTFDLGAARELTARARECMAGVDLPVLRTRLELLEGICGVVDGEPGARASILETLRPASENFDEVYSSGYSHLAYLDVEQRRLTEAVDVLDTSLPLTVEWDVPICHVWQLGVRARLHLLRGDWTAAEADAEDVLRAPSAPLARGWPLLVRGLLRLRRAGDDGGDVDAAWALATRYGEPLRLLPAAAALVERAWLTGRPDDRLDQARALLRRSRGAGLEWPRGELAVWLQRLGSAPRTDDIDVAEPHRMQLSGAYAEAADALARLGTPYDRALVLLDHGEPGTVREGLDLLDRLGADAAAARARQVIRDRGVVGVPGRRRSSTRTNPAGLTSREVEVLRLLDEGLSNAEVAARLYISPKTADHHVSAILTKLQVASRRQAAVAGRQLGIVAEASGPATPSQQPPISRPSHDRGLRT